MTNDPPTDQRDINADDDNAEDLIPFEKFPERVPVERHEVTLDPWHKPRKHWIRENQWARAAGRLFQKLQFDGRPLYYFSLPGKHLLDVRHLHRLCESKKIPLRFLGFDSSRKDDPAISISIDEVRQLPFIHRESDLKADRLEDLRGQTVALKALQKFPHFDIVNLDLCTSVADGNPATRSSCLHALRTLLQLQSARRGEPWYLYITTRADREAVDSEVMTTLCGVVESNINNSGDFKEAILSSGLVDIQDLVDEINRSPAGADHLVEAQFRSVFGIGFSKWLLQLALNTWKVKLDFCAGYRAGVSDEPNMLSLVYEFSRRPEMHKDQLGLMMPSKSEERQEQVSASADDEVNAAIRFVGRFAQMQDVDLLFVDDAELRKTFARENAKLMEEARFNFQTTYEWGMNTYWKPH